MFNTHLILLFISGDLKQIDACLGFVLLFPIGEDSLGYNCVAGYK